MTKRKSTKRALLMSGLALMICVAMLIGSTFAWFTDSATTGSNVIKSGKLDVVLEMENENGQWVSAEGETLKWVTKDNVENVLWEPGCRYQLPKLRIRNAGNLALKYQVIISGFEGDAMLADVIEFTGKPAEGKYESLAPNDYNEFTIEGHMPETAGNEYMGKTLTGITITVLATQDTVESDSYSNLYDENATLPAIDIKDKLGTDITLTANIFSVTVPAEAEEGKYKLVATNKKITENTSDEATLSFDLELLKDGVKVEPTDGILYDVEVEVGTLLNITKLTHNGKKITDFSYENGVVSFKTASFSPFTITYTKIPDDFETEDGKVTGGVAEGVNPADYDPSLKTADSEYIAINYEKDGKTYYTVAKRSTTVIVAADAAADYTAINGNYTVTTNQSGKLYSLISGLQSKEHSTVYLLPGTYTEATTINVYSSMDIIGLGDKESIKVVKGASNGSNRHLFNCNGSKEDYIQVTIRNMSLEVHNANIKDNKEQDNAAVQSIRRSMVKCYDLIINKTKGGGFENYAFYVNANNEVTSNSGVYCDAYLYAENTVINGSASTLSTAQKSLKTYYHFNHYNLIEKSGNKYTKNSGNIKNKKMELNDWEW